MGISVEEAIHELRNREEVFVAYSQATRLPYVTCDEETFNDQARIFATEEEIKEYGKQLLEDKILLMGMKYEKRLSKTVWYAVRDRSEQCDLDRRRREDRD